MPNTYSLIASNTVGSGGAGSVTFSSIPQTYTDLIVKVSSRSNRADHQDYQYMIFNGSFATVYGAKQLLGDSNAAYSGSTTGNPYIYYTNQNGASSTASTFSNTEIYIPNYTSSNLKSVSIDNVQENNTTTTNQSILAIIAGLWQDTSAITSITFGPFFGSAFVEHSTFYLYGIKKS